MDVKKIKRDIRKKIAVMFSEDVKSASTMHKYLALGSLIDDYCSEDKLYTKRLYKKEKAKTVYYFSMEFLIGRLFENNLINLGIKDEFVQALDELEIDVNEIMEMEQDPGLGNGGLGRLAACFLDSLAALGMPGHGMGIRYQYGLFEQKIINGYQVEAPDSWLKHGYVWENRNIDQAVHVRFGGEVEMKCKEGKFKPVYKNVELINAIPYDISIVGYKNRIVNNLRLWSAESVNEDFDFHVFSKGDYAKAFERKSFVSSVSQVLYPDDSNERGKLLRLKQEYFFVSAGLQSIVEEYEKNGFHLKEFHEHIAVQINDTHPAMAVPELMRILMDEKDMEWDEAWNITVNTISYTNHTLMGEALERWPVSMMKTVSPRILMIIEEINERLLYSVFKEYSTAGVKPEDIAIIMEGQVNMARLAVVGSHSVNGVSKIHTEILKNEVMKNFYRLFPEKFNNKTNGISHRRWLLKANPELSKALNDIIGDSWICEPNNLIKLKTYENDPQAIERIGKAKRANKEVLSNYIYKKYGISVDPDSIFDVHAKRLHMYKRQLLNILNIMDLYNRLLDNPDLDITPRTFIFSAKTSPNYSLAKQVIKLINSVAEKINNDKRIKDKIKVLFLENYGVTLAERIMPAADVSEQISTASKEASGTGNMKLMMNGAVTIATMDGANIEIYEAVGKENMVIFGMSVQEVLRLTKSKSYSSFEIMMSDQRLQKIVGQLTTGFLDEPDNEFDEICRYLFQENDNYYVFKDFASYVDAQNRIDRLYRDKHKWNKMCLTNIACSGRFSSDYTIKEYASDIWGIKSVL